VIIRLNLVWTVWGCGRSSDLSCLIDSVIAAAECRYTLSWTKRTTSDSIPLCLLQIAGFSFDFSIMVYDAAVVPCSKY